MSQSQRGTILLPPTVKRNMNLTENELKENRKQTEESVKLFLSADEN